MFVKVDATVLSSGYALLECSACGPLAVDSPGAPITEIAQAHLLTVHNATIENRVEAR